MKRLVGPSDGAGNHNISFVDTTESTGNYVGFAPDTVVIRDWIV